MNLPSEKECTGVGVLADGQFLAWHPGDREIQRVESDATAVTVADMYRVACEHKLNTVWLCPGSQASLRLHEQPGSFVPDHLYEEYKITAKRRDSDGVVQNAKITTKAGQWGHKPYVYIIAPDHDPTWLEDQQKPGESWSFSDVENPREFMGTLVSIHQKTGVHLSTSPAATGVQSMKLLTRPEDWRIDAGESELPDAKPTAIYWHRPLFDNEEGWYAHRGDRNSQFIAACTGAELGIGAPTYLDGNAARDAWQRCLNAALWNVEVRPEKKHGILQPHKAEWEGPRWLTTSGVRALHNLGYSTEIFRAHIWENDKDRKIVQHRRVLKDYGTQTWQQRQELREKYGKDNPAARLMSMTYKRGLGWLDLQGTRHDAKISWYHKPHWYAEIQGLAEYRMALTMQMMLEKYGVYPVLAYADAFIYLSKEPDPRKAFPDLFRREHELGGFKPDMSLRVTPEVMAAFRLNGTSMVIEKLKEIEHGTHV